MKKLLLFTLLFFIPFYAIYAESVSVNQALRVATNFSQQISGSQLRSGQTLKLVYTAKSDLRSNNDNAYFYVFNRDGGNGFVIVSGDDRALPILGYSDSGDFSYEEAPDNMKWWLGQYSDQIQYACENITVPDSVTEKEWDKLLSGKMENVILRAMTLVTAEWSQREPYNNQCPTLSGKRTLTGCVATAMAIVMKYHEYPKQGQGSASTSQGGYKANFNVTYQWDKMLDKYEKGSYSDEEAEAVATLNYHCGVSCNMKYGTGASSATAGLISTALPKYFNYHKSILYVKKDDYNNSEWEEMINDELSNGRPVIYNGNGTGGHAFIFDGSNGSQYHVNWGWGGSPNGWFSLTALNPDNDNYSSDQAMIVNIIPKEGGAYANQLRLSVDSRAPQTEGIKANKTPQPGQAFNVSVSAVRTESPTFSGSLVMVHCDKDLKIKETVSSTFDREFSPGSWFYGISFNNCKINQRVEEGDLICLAVKIGNEYKIIEGRTDLVSSIVPTPGEIIIEYKVTKITSNVANMQIVAETGYDRNSIKQGEDFKFKIQNPTDRELIVKHGNTVIEPNESGVYTIVNVQSNIELDITAVKTEEYTITLPKVEGATTTPNAGDHQVTKGEDFIFHITLDEAYDNSEPVVTIDRNNETITPGIDGAYVIENVSQTIKVNIQGIVKNVNVANDKYDVNKVSVKASDGMLHIYVPQSAKVSITTTSGVLYKTLNVVEGDTRIALPKGVYIVVVGEQSFKVLL